jgi:energy-coupling factor transport system substrate-specific component
MKELVTMWRDTRMVVLTSLCAAIYVAVLLPFKIATIIPGFTEVRPGAALPVLLALLFGPAGAWGAGLGNLIADLLGGMFGPGSVPGFLGNFLYGFVAYKLWRVLRGERSPRPRSAADWAVFQVVLLTSAVTCALVIGWGVDLFGLVPFAVLGTTIAINNAVVCLVLVNVLIVLVAPRIEAWRLLYTDILSPDALARGRGRRRTLGAVLVLAAVWIGFPLAIVLSAAGGKIAGATSVGAGIAPAVAALLAGCLLL